MSFYPLWLGLIMLGLVVGRAELEPALAQTGQGQLYVIQHNDTLWRLAEKYLGNGNLFPLIVEATAAKAASEPGLTPIAEPNLLHPGQKIWIPGQTDLPEPVARPAVVGPEPGPGQESAGPAGHIAFSFWNNHPNRCTYEINVIDVAACLADPGQCQASRRILPLNNVSEPALAPDGSRLAFRAWGEIPESGHPFAACAAAFPARYLGNTTLDGTDFRGTGGFWEDSHPDWSPDGRRLIFDTGRNGDGLTRIMTINPDGSNEEDLRIAGQQPSWAPDSHRFVYRGCDFYGNGCGLRLAQAIAVKPWETGQNLGGLVVEDSQAAHPDWSPVADEIVYQSPNSGRWALYLVNTDGRNRRQLRTEAALAGLPVWSPDGKWIAYLASDGSRWRLAVLDPESQTSRTLFTYDGGFYALPAVVEPYGLRDWLDEQISWSE
jgi:hypothetical protein